MLASGFASGFGGGGVVAFDASYGGPIGVRDGGAAGGAALDEPSRTAPIVLGAAGIGPL